MLQRTDIEQNTNTRIDPHRFALWVAIASICMMFAGLTSAFVVRRAAGMWLEFPLPNLFMYSTIAIIASSVTMHLSYSNFKQGNERSYKSYLITTGVLGCIFVALQYQGWLALTEMGATITANPSSSFIYLISGAHAAHVLGGIAALAYALIQAYVLPFNPIPKRQKRFNLVVNYWHFVDLLWVYLFVFFMMYR
jgi:cytochrome c oxidase subunit III